jgi:copper chaperone CopZ
MSEHHYTVEGMTCAHCVAAVTNEVSQIPGAEHVEVDLESGSLAIEGEDIDTADVRSAVEEAGYSLVS